MLSLSLHERTPGAGRDFSQFCVRFPGGRPLFVMLALLGIFAGRACGQGPAEIQKELADVAKSIAGVLAQRNDNRIAVGQFTGPSRIPSSSGPAIAKALSDELTRLGLTISRRASLEVKGDYLPVVGERSRGPAALLKGRVLDAGGNTVYEFEKGFSSDITVASLFGLTVELPPDVSPRERRQKIRESIEEPAARITSSRISAGPSSPYSLEVLVKTGPDWVPRAPVDDEGLAFVELNPEDTYAVRFYNDSPYDAAVTLTIDGLNLFTFSENPAYKQLGVVIIGAKSSGTITGWHRTNDKADSFLVTEYAKSAAAELDQAGEIGTITCSVSAAWTADATPPPDETTRSQAATGRGPEIAAQFRETQRVIGKTRSAISCRYSRPAPAAQ